MKFKTNAKCGGCKSAILSAVEKKFPDMVWSLNLDDEDKILECHGVPSDNGIAAQVVSTIEETGFKASLLS